MNYSEYEGTFDFDEQDRYNYIIYGVRVKYNSREEGNKIWDIVEDHLDMIRTNCEMEFGHIIVGFKLMKHSNYDCCPTSLEIPPKDELDKLDEQIKQFFPSGKPKLYYFPTMYIR